MNQRPALRSRPQPRIGTCLAEFSVASPDSTLDSPDHLVGALRAELLPVLEQVLAQGPIQHANANIEQLEIDLGQWPEPPDWVELRLVFAQKLRTALAPYLQWPDTPFYVSASDKDLPAPVALAQLPDPEFLQTVRRYLRPGREDLDGLRDRLLGTPGAFDTLAGQLGTDAAARLKDLLTDPSDTKTAMEDQSAESWRAPPRPATLTKLSDTAFLKVVSARLAQTPEHRETLHQSLLGSPHSIEALLDQRGRKFVLRLQQLLSDPITEPNGSPPDTAGLWQMLRQTLPQMDDARRVRWIESALNDKKPVPARHKLELLQNVASKALRRTGFLAIEADQRAAMLTARLASDPDFKVDELTAILPDQQTRDIRMILASFDLDGVSLAALRLLYRDAPEVVKKRIFERLPQGRRDALLAELGSLLRPKTQTGPVGLSSQSSATPKASETIKSRQKLVDFKSNREPSPKEPDRITNPADVSTHDFSIGVGQTTGESIRALLSNPSLTAAEFRKFWFQSHASLEASFHQLTPDDLEHLIAVLLPQGALQLEEKIDQFKTASDTASLRSILQHMLEDRPIDFEKLQRARGEPRSTRPNSQNARRLRLHVPSKSEPRRAAGSPNDPDSQDPALPEGLAQPVSPPDASEDAPAETRPQFHSSRLHDAEPKQKASGDIAVALGMLDTQVLDQLIDKLLPKSASLLRDAISKALEIAPTPSFDRTLILIDLLEDRPVDLEGIAGQAMELAKGPTDKGPTGHVDEQAFRIPDQDDPPFTPETAAADVLERWGATLTATEVSAIDLRRAWAEVFVKTTEAHNDLLARWANKLTELGATISKPLATSARRIRLQPVKDSQDNEHPAAELLRAAGVPDADIPKLLSNLPLAAQDDKGAKETTGSRGSETSPSDMRMLIEPDQATLVLKALVEAGLPQGHESWLHSLDLIWRSLPLPRGAIWQAKNTNKSDAETQASPLVPLDETHRLSPQYWRLLVDALLLNTDRPDTLTDVLDQVFKQVEPDTEVRLELLRLVVARLSYAVGTGQPATRQITHAAAKEVLQRTASQEQPGQEPAVGIDRDLTEQRQTEPVATEVAGLVLLHPYLRLLFQRLDVLDSDGKIPKAALSRAFSILQAITNSKGPPDPLHYVLLGMEGRPKLEAQELEPEATTLITGLLQAVINQWGKLGKTSPNGLRETFLIRPGRLEVFESGTHLNVVPGPFDMLLDALPWALGPVAMPWMQAPCHVNWRSEDG